MFGRTIKKSDEGVSAAGEVTLTLAGLIVLVILLCLVALWWLYNLAVGMFGTGFVNGVLLALVVLTVGMFIYSMVTRFEYWSRIRNAEARQLELQANYLHPNENGLIPVVPHAAEHSLQLALAHQRSRWTVNDLPNSFHYHYNNTALPSDAVLDSEQSGLSIQPQTFWELFSNKKLPEHGFLMGYSLEDGHVVNADWSKLYSALIGGQSGSGKSTLIRNILAQSALQGGRFLILDPHYGAGGESLGASLQPLHHLMLADVASNDKQYLDTLSYIRDIGQRRLTGRDNNRTPVVLIVDETTALLQRSAAAEPLKDALGEIAQETRKVGVYAMCIGQNFHSSVMDTTVRDSFVSFISCRARRNVARTMTDDNEFGKAAQQLKTGQAVWMTPAGEMWTMAVPNCTQNDLELVAKHVSGEKHDLQVVEAPSKPPSKPPSEVPSDFTHSEGVNLQEPKVRQVLAMMRDGYSQSDIIRTGWGIKKLSGGAYQDAVNEYRQIVAAISAKVEVM